MADQQNHNSSVDSIAENGMTIFLDVFRRADKNDDGFISWEEFISYFADGVMGKEELQSLFDEIDSHNTNNIDTGELCAYFSQHLGDFKEIFGIIELLNKKMTNVLYSTSQAYQESNRTQKFVTRFLMREIINQLSALQSPLEAASDTLDTQAREERSDITPLEMTDALKKPSTGGIIPGRVVRRAKRQISAPPSTGLEAFDYSEDNSGNTHLNNQISKLADLIEQLESKVNFDNFRDEEVITGSDDTLLLVHREFALKESPNQNFQANLRAYVDVTQGFNGCLNISVRDLRDLKTFSLYEMWTSEEQYKNNCDGNAYKAMMDKSSELLQKPSEVKAIKIPKSWWRGQV